MADAAAPAKAPDSQATPNPPSAPVDFYNPLAGGGAMLNSMLDSAGEHLQKIAFDNTAFIQEDRSGRCRRAT
jgi:hypothetical protein